MIKIFFVHILSTKLIFHFYFHHFLFFTQVSANNILLLHLGIVDSILCMLFLIFSLPSIAKSDGAVVFEAICSVHGFLLTLMHPIALWTICCLNCDRYYAISAPLHYSAIVNTKKVHKDFKWQFDEEIK